MDLKVEEMPIVQTQDGSGSEPILEGRVDLNPDNEQVAPLEESPVKVMLELTGSGSTINGPGLDLVTILDTSYSMRNDNKLDKLRNSMQFLIKKLTPNDRLSIVTFDDYAEIVCGLRVVSDSFKATIVNNVKALVPRNSYTNITDGIKTGLKILESRQYSGDRVVGIMLMSDGEQNFGGDATTIKIDNVPVFTFSFGINDGSKVLRAIADNSRGGTFSDVQVLDDLNSSFAQLLAGLVTVIVHDLQLNIQSRNSTKIIKVSAGSYVKDPDNDMLVTVLFGYLYDKEVRSVMVDLLLPAVAKTGDVNVLEASFSYSVGTQQFKSRRFLVFVERTDKPVQREKEKVTVEKKRLEATKLMKEAREKAEQTKIVEAKKLLNEAQQLLRGFDPNNPVIKTLKYEQKHLLSSLKSFDDFKQKGLPFALSSETCHERQRFAARGDAQQVRLFATPRMDVYLEQAKAFDRNPDMPLPTSADDAKQELAADPLAPIAGALSYHIQSAIQSLQAIASILDKSR